MIGAIVLAAGASTRMGRQKLLMPIGGTPLIRHVIEQLLQAPVDPVVVVTGHDRSAVEDVLSGLAIHFAHNPKPSDGMLSSVRTGIRALPDSAHALVALGDQPAIPPDTVSALVQTFESNRAGIVVPVAKKMRGHPVLIHARYRNEILNDFDDVGLRGLLHRHSSTIVECPVDETGVLVDIDTPADYARVAGRQNRK